MKSENATLFYKCDICENKCKVSMVVGEKPEQCIYKDGDIEGSPNWQEVGESFNDICETVGCESEADYIDEQDNKLCADCVSKLINDEGHEPDEFEDLEEFYRAIGKS